MFEAYQDTSSERQLAMVIDLNKCMGCQTCSVACKRLWTDGDGQEHMWWNKVNTMPGEGSPRGWEDMGGGFDAEGVQVGPWRLGGGRARPSELPDEETFGEYMELPREEVVHASEGEVHTSPEERPEWTYNWDEDRGAGEYPNTYFFYLPRLCNHCTRPACLEACPRDAIYKRDEDGLVLINEERCEGYRFCMEACPYKVIYFNPEEGVASNGAGEQGIAQKCIGCFPRVERGVPPACVRQCPGRARFYGYLDGDGPVRKLVREWEVALPLHPEYHTEPNVYYVPPLSSSRLDEEGRTSGEPRIPREYLRSLFGGEVDRVLKVLRKERRRMKEGEDSELMNLLIGWRWPDDFFGDFTEDPDLANDPCTEEETP